MAESFLSLSALDRRDAPVHLLEKAVWVAWVLQTIFGSAFGGILPSRTKVAFKGL